MRDIRHARILIIATNAFEQAELEVLQDKLGAAGARVATRHFRRYLAA